MKIMDPRPKPEGWQPPGRVQTGGVGGHRSETDDELHDLEIYERLTNPNGQGGAAPKGGRGGPMMLPPGMMGGSQTSGGGIPPMAPAASTATTANRLAAIPTSAGGPASPGGMGQVGTSAAGSSFPTGGIDVNGDGVIDASDSLNYPADGFVATDSGSSRTGTASGWGPGDAGSRQVLAGGATPDAGQAAPQWAGGSAGVADVDPDQLTSAASSWQELSARMIAVKGEVDGLRLSPQQTGFATLTKDGYGTMNGQTSLWAANGSRTFTEFSQTLLRSAQQYRETEANNTLAAAKAHPQEQA